jgi:hypothetical protein
MPANTAFSRRELEFWSAERKGPFGGLSASEAARRSYAPSSARHDPADTSDAAIIRKLRSKAARGDVAAARELREWAAKDPEHKGAGDEWLALLAPEERAVVRDLMRHVRAREPGQVEGLHLSVGVLRTWTRVLELPTPAARAATHPVPARV